jgi:heterodisulfide reductase subunit A-like polyferredoxin
MPDNKISNKKIGAALVVGSGIGGMQAALDLAESGIKVYLADNKPAVGGVMAQLDKTFPTNDCAMCTMAPRLVETGRNKDIEIITLANVEKIAGEPGHFKITLKKKARYIDEDKCTGCGECPEVCPISIPDKHNTDIGETKAIYRRYPQAVPNTFAIEKLGRSPCRCTCPAGQKVQGYIALIREKRYEEAFHVIVRDNPLPSVCGRVCKHYCEEECTRTRVDEPVSIMNLKRFIADWAYEKKLTRKKTAAEKEHNENNSKRVAIIGSGPAGLTAAQDLGDLGYSVTICEALSEPGGMMRFGVPQFRLPRERLQWDIQNILSNGIELKTNHKIESIDSLLDNGFHAVFIASGLHTGKKLPITGNDLPDVLVNMDFLRDVAMGKEVKLKERVLVLGGGNVAMDVARTAVRLGAHDVRLACLESGEQMPADPWEIEDAKKEGIKIFPSRSFLEITSQNGNVTGVKCIKVNFRGFDKDGRPDMDLIKGSEHTIEADTVIFAIGQAAEMPFAHEGIELTKAGTIKIDEDTLATSKQGVFAGGDVVTGTKFIVDGIAAGHRAAKSIDRYLNGQELKQVEPLIPKVELTDEQVREKIRSEKKRHAAPFLPVKERKRSFSEAQQGYTEEMALKEAERCLECGICSECLLCKERCEAGAINHEMPAEEIIELDVGAVILSPGFEIFDANIKEDLGYGRYPNVLNALEFERVLSASGPFSGEVLRPYDKKTPKRIGFIQCVGSRDHERDYCSSVCCMYATKEAIIAKEHVGEDLECDIFFMDMRAFSKGFDEYYERAKSLGVNYIRCRPPTVEEIPETKNLLIEYLTEDEKSVSQEYDLVVLSVGMQPPKSVHNMAERFGIELNEFDFCKTSVFGPVESSRDGIYVSGPFTEPKDIPETVMQASSASSQVLSLLKDVRGSLIIPKEYPPEIDVSGQEPRIGVFVCHCGTNIAGVVNVPDVVEYTNTLSGVVYTDNNLYTCSNDTQEKIKEKIIEHQLNRVIVASCTPRTHEPLFADTLREAGLNPYLFEMANIRDQCSWVHMHEPGKATEKSKDLVRMAVAKARLLEPLEKRSIPIIKSALVIGAGLAGMASALGLANEGFNVYLVEKGKELGGNLRRIHYLLNGEKPQDELKNIIKKVKENDKIQLFTEANIENIEGSIGNFNTKILTNGGSKEFEHGVVIVATGAKEYKPTEYLYGQDERVITQLEFEQGMAADGDWFAADGKQPAKTVVLIQCVGSRSKERPYCSRVCCIESVKTALKIKEVSPAANIFVLYRDVRTYGFKESYYTRARQKDVMFIRYEEDRKPEVSRNGSGLQVEVFDRVLNMPIEISADLVVLSAGIIPGEENEQIAKFLKVPVTNDGFFLEAHMKLRPVDFATDGIFLCGLSHSAKRIEESIIQARAASSRAATVLSKDSIELEAKISQVVDENCDGCAFCIEPCPYNAITLIEYMRKGAVKKTVETDETACKGCGTCQATCPKIGIFVRGFKLEQIAAQVNAAIGVE